MQIKLLHNNFILHKKNKINFFKNDFIYKKFFSKKKSNILPSHSIPLTQEFPGVPKNIFENIGIQKPETKITILSNGLKVATEERFGQSAAIGLFIECGSIYEPNDLPGISHVLEKMAFKTTKTRTTKEIVQELEALGGNIMSSSSREVISYSAEVVRDHIEKLIDYLADTVINPLFEENDLLEQKELIVQELMEQQKDIPSLLPEVMHEVAFSSQPLGKTMFCNEYSLENISTQDLFDFHSKNYIPNRMVLAVCGEEHDLIVKLTQKYFQFPVSNYPPHQRLLSKYIGGEQKIEAENIEQTKAGIKEKPFSHLMLGFESCGVENEDIYSVFTLQSLLGGGGSFSSGGPGKGMHSRLYRNVLNGHSFVEAVNCFNHSYWGVGIFGIYAVVRHGSLTNMLEVLISELLSIVENIEEEELMRAKNQLKSSLLMNLESRSIACDDIGRQVLFYNKRYTAEYICEQIDSLTTKNLQNTLVKMLLSKPTLVVFGLDTNQVPGIDVISKIIKAHIH